MDTVLLQLRVERSGGGGCGEEREGEDGAAHGWDRLW